MYMCVHCTFELYKAVLCTYVHIVHLSYIKLYYVHVCTGERVVSCMEFCLK